MERKYVKAINLTPELVKKVGSADIKVGDITIRYSKLKDDVQYRREWSERVGLGFSVGLFGLQNKATLRIVKVA
jgi:hypothetical protein